MSGATSSKLEHAHLWAGVAVAAGVAFVIGGATLLAVHAGIAQKPAAWLLWAGWGFIALGGFLLTGVGGWWMRGRHRKRKTAKPRWSMGPVVYNEGRWWLRLASSMDVGTVSVRCEVRDPGHEWTRYEFDQSGSSFLAWYPQRFGVPRPLSDGTYKVRWKIRPIDGKRFRRVAGGSFDVEGDAAIVERIHTLLDVLREEGQRLLDTLPGADEGEWTTEATTWAGLMDGRLRTLPEHFEPQDVRPYWSPEGESVQESRTRVMQDRVTRLEEIKARFQ